MRAHWGSKLGFILATAGSAIGLGNIWRFPYLLAQNSGGAFLLMYLFCVIFLGYFLLTSKLTFGRIAQTNFINGFQKVCPKKISPLWGKSAGFLTILNIILVSSIYLIVIGWTLSYVVVAGQNLFHLADVNVNQGLFEKVTSSYFGQLFWGILCVASCCFILIKGVKGGIEKASLYLMPILFVLLILMAFWSFSLPNSSKGFAFLFTPDWTKLGFHSDGFQLKEFAHIALLALGQAIYSLSLGMGVCFIYGSYLKPDVDIKKAACWIVGLDTCVALLASCIILPAVFAFDMPANQGPGLTFITLPFVFNQVNGGAFFMFLFFILLFVAALTSLISIYEPIINLLMEKKHMKRWKATLCIAFTNILCSMIILASFTKKWQIKLLGRDLFDFVDYLSGSYTMGLLVLIYCIFMGWKIFPQIMDNLQIKNKWLNKYFLLVLRYLTPLVLVVLFFSA